MCEKTRTEFDVEGEGMFCQWSNGTMFSPPHKHFIASSLNNHKKDGAFQRAHFFSHTLHSGSFPNLDYSLLNNSTNYCTCSNKWAQSSLKFIQAQLKLNKILKIKWTDLSESSQVFLHCSCSSQWEELPAGLCPLSLRNSRERRTGI